jgi:hypothetical protein
VWNFGTASVPIPYGVCPSVVAVTTIDRFVHSCDHLRIQPHQT